MGVLFGGFIWGCSIVLAIPVLTGHPECVPFSMKVEQEQSPAQPVPCSVCIQLALTVLEGIILGTHHEKGAFTFWSYAIGLPLPSSAILSWKFCHVLHKVLRDGHPNVSVPSAMSVLLHWQGKFLALANIPLHKGWLPFPTPATVPRPWDTLLSRIFETSLCSKLPRPLGATERLELLPKGLIPPLPQHQGRQAGAQPCQPRCATSLPFFVPRSSRTARGTAATSERRGTCG